MPTDQPGPDPIPDPPLTDAERAALTEPCGPHGQLLHVPDESVLDSLARRGLLDDGDTLGPRLTVAGRRVRRELLAEPRAAYPRYRPGDPDPTPNPAGDCPATAAGAYVCTRPAGHRNPQHVAGASNRRVVAVWTGDGADLAEWDGGVSAPAPGAARSFERELDRLGAGYGALLSALTRCRLADLGDLTLLASLELPHSTVVRLPGESAREAAARHDLVLETSRSDPGTYRFFGPATQVAALLREVAGVCD